MSQCQSTCRYGSRNIQDDEAGKLKVPEFQKVDNETVSPKNGGESRTGTMAMPTDMEI